MLDREDIVVHVKTIEQLRELGGRHKDDRYIKEFNDMVKQYDDTECVYRMGSTVPHRHPMPDCRL